MAYKYSRIVMTVGTSSLGRQNHYWKWFEENKLMIFQSDQQNAKLVEGVSIEDVVSKLKREFRSIEPFKNVKKVSAEFSTLITPQIRNILDKEPSIFLLHTKTDDGIIAAELLMLILEKEIKGAMITLKPFAMNVNDPYNIRSELFEFMSLTAGLLRNSDKNSTCFIPLGGYKIMITLGYLVGAYYGYQTVYMHENNQVLNIIPPIPINIRNETVAPYAKIMRKVSEAIDKSKLTSDELKQIEEFDWVFSIEDDIVALNMFGLFIMEDPRFLKEFKRLNVTREIDQSFNNKDLSFIKHPLSNLNIKIIGKPDRQDQDLYHEKEWKLTSVDGLHLYKGTSNGQIAFRCLYEYRNYELNIYYIWTDHNDYEREAEAQFRKFIPISMRIADIDWTEKIMQD